MSDLTPGDPVPDISESSRGGLFAFIGLILLAIFLLALKFLFSTPNRASTSADSTYGTGARGIEVRDVVIDNPPISPPTEKVIVDNSAINQLEVLKKKLELAKERLSAEKEKADAQYWKQRLENPIIVYNDTGRQAAISEEGAPNSNNSARYDSSSSAQQSNGIVVYGNERVRSQIAFQKEIAQTQTATAYATQLKNMDTMLVQGTVISAIMETAINTDLPGSARALISSPVYSYDGSQILLPTGSRLVGEYQSGIVMGDARVLIIWSRVITPDGISVRINSRGTDALGRSGLPGDVQSYFWQKLGASALVSILGVAGEYQYRVTNDLYEDYDAQNDRRRYIDEEDEAVLDAIRLLSADLAGATREAFQGWIERAPTIRIDQGTRVSILSNKDVDFSLLNNAR